MGPPGAPKGTEVTNRKCPGDFSELLRCSRRQRETKTGLLYIWPFTSDGFASIFGGLRMDMTGLNRGASMRIRPKQRPFMSALVLFQALNIDALNGVCTSGAAYTPCPLDCRMLSTAVRKKLCYRKGISRLETWNVCGVAWVGSLS